MNSPSIIEPFKLKYQDMAFSVFPLQPNDGVTPATFSSAEDKVDRLKVLDVLGVIPASDSQS